MKVIILANPYAQDQIPDSLTAFDFQRFSNLNCRQFFAVYNRWGPIVFQTKDPSKCSDGTFNGRNQGAGGYIYEIKATTICGEVFKGIVTLVREPTPVAA